MKTIKDYNGNNIDFEAAVILMDNEIREQLHGTALKMNRNFTTRIARSITRSITKNLKSKSKRA